MKAQRMPRRATVSCSWSSSKDQRSSYFPGTRCRLTSPADHPETSQAIDRLQGSETGSSRSPGAFGYLAWASGLRNRCHRSRDYRIAQPRKHRSSASALLSAKPAPQRSGTLILSSSRLFGSYFAAELTSSIACMTVSCGLARQNCMTLAVFPAICRESTTVLLRLAL